MQNQNLIIQNNEDARARYLLTILVITFFTFGLGIMYFFIGFIIQIAALVCLIILSVLSDFNNEKFKKRVNILNLLYLVLCLVSYDLDYCYGIERPLAIFTSYDCKEFILEKRDYFINQIVGVIRISCAIGFVIANISFISLAWSERKASKIS